MSSLLACFVLMVAVLLLQPDRMDGCSDWKSYGKTPPLKCARLDCPVYNETRSQFVERCYITCKIIVAQQRGDLNNLATIRKDLIKKLDHYFSGGNKQSISLPYTEPTWQKLIPSEHEPGMDSITIFRMIPFSAQKFPPEPLDDAGLYLKGAFPGDYCLYLPVSEPRQFPAGNFKLIKRVSDKFKDDLVKSGTVDEALLNVNSNGRYYVLTYQRSGEAEIGLIKKTW